MSESELSSILKRISDVAALAGIRGRIDEQAGAFMGSFGLDNDRSQTVMVRPTMRTREGKAVVTILSPCRVVDKGFWGGLSKDDALELLRHNENVPFARFGITPFGEGKEAVVASIDHILDTLDAEELHNHMWAVAMAADAYEAKHGRDEF